MQFGRIFASASALALAALSVVGSASAETKVQSVRLDPHGQPSGVILSDGSQLCGEINQKLTRVAVPGDPVRVELAAGDRIVLVNERTSEGATIGPRETVDLAPLIARPTRYGIGGGPPPMPPQGQTPYVHLDEASQLEHFAVVTRVALVLKAPSGAPAGLLMEDGTQVHVVPRLAGVLARFKPGESLRVEGLGTKNEHGKSMWALAITRDRTVFLDVGRGIGAPEIGIGPRPQP